MVKDYIKREWRGMLLALGVVLIIASLCWAYIVFIGQPITEARNKFNDGVKYMNIGDYSKAKQMLEESNKLWWTTETDNYILQVESKL